MYIIIIYKIDILLYGIKLDIKFLKIFDYNQSEIYDNNIYKTKYLLFYQIEILLFKIFKK